MPETFNEKQWFQAKLSLRGDGNGAFSGITVVARDVTERKRMAEERLMLQRRQLTEKTASLSRMAGAVADHFNNMLAVMAAMGLSPEQKAWSADIPEIDIDKMTYAENDADVLVIGGGMAGLFAAVKAHDAGSKVMLVSKGRQGSSAQTPFAKGIFAFDSSSAKMSLDEFVDTVSRSALGANNPVHTRQMAEHSLACVNELKQGGFFDSPLKQKFNKPIKERNIPVKERIVITHLIKENGRISGAAGFSLDEEKVLFFKAKSVILCTGAVVSSPMDSPFATSPTTALLWPITSAPK